MELLLRFPMAVEVLLVVVLFGSTGVAVLYLARLRIPLPAMKEHHDVLGFTFTVVGTFYAVVLAFVIIASWQRFKSAENKEQGEAVALMDLYRVAAFYPEPMRNTLRDRIRRYTEIVVEREWPAMADNSYVHSSGTLPKIWSVLRTYHPTTARDTVMFERTLQLLGRLNDARESRYMYYGDQLPGIVWVLIYFGFTISIVFTGCFATKHFWAQGVMCAVFSILIGITMLGITELSHPYQGDVHIPVHPMQYALSIMGK